MLLCREDSKHREHDLREVFNGLRYIANTGCQWRWMPHDGGVSADKALDGSGLL
jgi:transposase